MKNQYQLNSKLTNLFLALDDASGAAWQALIDDANQECLGSITHVHETINSLKRSLLRPVPTTKDNYPYQTAAELMGEVSRRDAIDNLSETIDAAKAAGADEGAKIAKELAINHGKRKGKSKGRGSRLKAHAPFLTAAEKAELGENSQHPF